MDCMLSVCIFRFSSQQLAYVYYKRHTVCCGYLCFCILFDNIPPGELGLQTPKIL